MGRGIPAVRIAVALGLVVTLAACNPPVRRHGYVPAETELALVAVGDSRQAVGDKVGRPSSAGLMQGGDWYYVGSTWRQVAWRAPQEIDRQVVAVRFDAEDRVENIERFGLADGRVVVLSRRVTDGAIEGVGFIQQLLGNLGNLTADQFLE